MSVVHALYESVRCGTDKMQCFPLWLSLCSPGVGPVMHREQSGFADLLD